MIYSPNSVQGKVPSALMGLTSEFGMGLNCPYGIRRTVLADCQKVRTVLENAARTVLYGFGMR